MSNKLEILKMIENGQISVEEGLALIEALDLTEHIDDENVKEKYVQEYTENFSSGDLKRFDIALVSCKLNVERSNVEDVTLEIRDDKTRELVEMPEWLTVKDDGKNISIKETRVSNISDIFNFFKGEKNPFNVLYINVKLPKDMIVDYGKFSSVSGSITLIGLNGVEIEGKSVSGKVYATDIKAKVIQLKSISGSVIADNVRAARAILSSTSGKIKAFGSHHQVKCSSVSGGIDYEGAEVLESFNANTVSGKVSIRVPSPELYNLTFDSVSGSIDTSGFAIVDKNISGARRVHVTNRSERLIKASTVSGGISLDTK